MTHLFFLYCNWTFFGCLQYRTALTRQMRLYKLHAQTTEKKKKKENLRIGTKFSFCRLYVYRSTRCRRHSFFPASLRSLLFEILYTILKICDIHSSMRWETRVMWIENKHSETAYTHTLLHTLRRIEWLYLWLDSISLGLHRKYDFFCHIKFGCFSMLLEGAGGRISAIRIMYTLLRSYSSSQYWLSRFSAWFDVLFFFFGCRRRTVGILFAFWVN